VFNSVSVPVLLAAVVVVLALPSCRLCARVLSACVPCYDVNGNGHIHPACRSMYLFLVAYFDRVPVHSCSYRSNLGSRRRLVRSDQEFLRCRDYGSIFFFNAVKMRTKLWFDALYDNVLAGAKRLCFPASHSGLGTMYRFSNIGGKISSFSCVCSGASLERV